MNYKLTGKTKQIGGVTVYQICYPSNSGKVIRIGGWIDKPELLQKFPKSYLGKNSIVYCTTFYNDFYIHDDCLVAHSYIEPHISLQNNTIIDNSAIYSVEKYPVRFQQGCKVQNKEFHAIGTYEASFFETQKLTELYYKSLFILLGERFCRINCQTYTYAEAKEILTNDILWKQTIDNFRAIDGYKIATIEQIRDQLINLIKSNS